MLQRHASNSSQRRRLMIHEARQPFGTFARGHAFYFRFDHKRHHNFPSQREPAQNHDRDRHNRTDQQRPHEKAASREKSENDIHDSRRFGNDPGDDHPLGKIMNPSPSTSKPSDGNDCATSSGIGGRCASSTDCTHTLANASFELFSVTLSFFTRPLRSTTNPKRKVPMLIKSRFCSTYVYHREPIESATIFW